VPEPARLDIKQHRHKTLSTYYKYLHKLLDYLGPGLPSSNTDVKSEMAVTGGIDPIETLGKTAITDIDISTLAGDGLPSERCPLAQPAPALAKQTGNCQSRVYGLLLDSDPEEYRSLVLNTLCGHDDGAVSTLGRPLSRTSSNGIPITGGGADGPDQTGLVEDPSLASSPPRGTSGNRDEEGQEPWIWGTQQEAIDRIMAELARRAFAGGGGAGMLRVTGAGASRVAPGGARAVGGGKNVLLSGDKVSTDPRLRLDQIPIV
jgi:hypothetical protein